ncbi:flagellar hook-associated protein FlgK [Sulfitobacter aestuarii]|uniref:Flagellar hook-associated protein 1 n=1 Tax=Sulfitobacter aestuarii TaxID=2161676 RepID=A0ABW5U7U8_9RHOB
MTINAALSNAMSGPRAAGRSAEVISSNISNALTPGYAKRTLSLSVNDHGGGGVRMVGISRASDPALLSERHLAEAAQGQARSITDFFATLENLLGTPDDPASLTAGLARFESALITAASRPDASERLDLAVTEARRLATGIRDASVGIQKARTQADGKIAIQVNEFNEALQQVETLNRQISVRSLQGGNTASLTDQRQLAIDQISTLVPLRSMVRENGAIALYATSGARLLDGSAAVIGFEPVNLVTPYMTQDGGSLSGLTINGKAIDTDPDHGALRGGSLSAQFAVRDHHGVAAQVQLDAFARDLISRFQDSALDPTLVPGDAGLFTDDGAHFDPVNEPGLAERLALNQKVDPNQGGVVWRLRDGLNATTPGEVGDASLLGDIGEALRAARPPASGSFGGSPISTADLLTRISASFSSKRHSAEQELSFESSRMVELQRRERAEGVDSDDELQRLMLIEQIYAANARVIETVEEMMQTILRL